MSSAITSAVCNGAEPFEDRAVSGFEIEEAIDAAQQFDEIPNTHRLVDAEPRHDAVDPPLLRRPDAWGRCSAAAGPPLPPCPSYRELTGHQELLRSLHLPSDQQESSVGVESQFGGLFDDHRLG